MADPLRHNCKLDIAEEILQYIADNPSATDIRELLRRRLHMDCNDFDMAHEVVADIRNLLNNQKF